MQDKVLYKTGADHFLQGLSKGIPIKNDKRNLLLIRLITYKTPLVHP